MQRLAETFDTTTQAIDQLAAGLAQSRRRRALAQLIDFTTLSALFAAVSFGIARYAGWPSGWIGVTAIGAVIVLLFRRTLSLDQIAQELDRASGSHELFSSAWAARHDSRNTWNAAVANQAARQVDRAAEQKQWNLLPARVRSSILLLAGAMAVLSAMSEPAVDRDSTVSRAGTAQENAQRAEAAIAWVTPRAALRQNDDPDEAGRTIPTDTAGRVQRSGDDAAGGGHADAFAASKLESSAVAHSAQSNDATANQHSGSGEESTSATHAGPTQATGRVATQSHDVINPMPHIGSASAAPPASDQHRVISPVYQELVRAYFQR